MITNNGDTGGGLLVCNGLYFTRALAAGYDTSDIRDTQTHRHRDTGAGAATLRPERERGTPGAYMSTFVNTREMKKIKKRKGIRESYILYFFYQFDTTSR